MNNSTKVTLVEVEQFNRKIKDFSKNLNDCLETIDRSMNELSRSWDDPVFQQFKSNFNKHATQLKPLSEQLAKYNKHIDAYWVPKIKSILDQYKNNP
jgi:uncharacterized protein YukE